MGSDTPFAFRAVGTYGRHVALKFQSDDRQPEQTRGSKRDPRRRSTTQTSARYMKSPVGVPWRNVQAANDWPAG
jgi:hypothetical protein